MPQVLILNGPNLNLLGVREPEIYGHTTLADIEESCRSLATELNLDLDWFQSNSEEKLIERLHRHFTDPLDYIIINPAAFTHTSVALRDAIAATGVPFVEIHLSNVHSREPFRHHSYFSDLATGVICGLGHRGYQYAMQFISDELATR